MRFSTDTADKFLAAYRKTQNISKAAEAIQVSRQTLYRWFDKYPDFKMDFDAMDRELNKKKNPPPKQGVVVETEWDTNYQLAVSRLTQMLIEGYKERVKRVETKYNSAGEIILTTETITETEKPTPSWVISRYIPPMSEDTELLQKMVLKNYISLDFANKVETALRNVFIEIQDFVQNDEQKQKLEHAIALGYASIVGEEPDKNLVE